MTRCSFGSIVLFGRRITALLPKSRSYPLRFGSQRPNPVERGVVSPTLTVPEGILRPPYVGASSVPAFESPYVNSPDEVDAIRRACRLARRVLKAAGELVKPGVTTDEIDRFVHRSIVESGAYPSPLGYKGFPKSVCTSVNSVVGHGIPDSRPLREGDIINIDVTVYLETKGLGGFHGDTSATFAVGLIDSAAERLLTGTRDALHTGVGAVRPGRPVSDIGEAIDTFVRRRGLNVFPEITGHGVGREFHRAPWIFHSRNSSPEVMLPGMVFTIEPCITSGDADFFVWDDGWTSQTVDFSWSAQFEHTVLVTPDGVEVLTA